MYQVPADNSESAVVPVAENASAGEACRRQTSGSRSSQRSGSSCCRGKPKADGPWFGGVVVPVSCRDRVPLGQLGHVVFAQVPVTVLVVKLPLEVMGSPL